MTWADANGGVERIGFVMLGTNLTAERRAKQPMVWNGDLSQPARFLLELSRPGSDDGSVGDNLYQIIDSDGSFPISSSALFV